MRTVFYIGIENVQRIYIKEKQYTWKSGLCGISIPSRNHSIDGVGLPVTCVRN